jgi:hypothetical protein
VKAHGYRALATAQKLLASCILILFAVVTISAQGAVIDDFTQGGTLLQPTQYIPAMVALQTGLDTNSTIGGTRRLTAQTQNQATLQVDTEPGEFFFEAVADWGYFKVEYGTEAPLGLDVRADGSEAFLLSFSNVSMPGLWRGLYYFRVNGISHDLLRDLAAIHGRGTIRIPFSRFSTAPNFIVNQISFEAGRVEPRYRLVLDSIVTVNAHTPPGVSIGLQKDGELELSWSTNATGFLVQTTRAPGVEPWQTLSNTVNVVGDRFSVKVRESEAAGYFRLLSK